MTDLGQKNNGIGGRILIIDDEPVVCLSCEETLSSSGYEVVSFQDAKAGLEEALKGTYDLVLLDLVMPEMDGMEVLRHIRNCGVFSEVIIITGHATVKTAVESMKRGAKDYIQKPFTPKELRAVTRKVMEHSKRIQENIALRKELAQNHGFEGMIGESKEMELIFTMIRRVAPTEGSVLITGESGTGKDIIAKIIHKLSPRHTSPFLVCDCCSLASTLLESELFGHVKGAFSGAQTDKKGLFDAANNGTLLLDELGNISLEIQSKLLRVLETRNIKRVGDVDEHEVNIRLISATNADIKKMVKIGTFREDLYYRLNVVPIHVPPLRERKGDIPKLSMFFIDRFRKKNPESRVKGFTLEAMAMMEAYGWPGNVRELKNIVERLAILGEAEYLEPSHLPNEIFSQENPISVATLPSDWEEFKKLKSQIREASVQDLERRFILNALKKTNWNVSQAARDVGLQRTHFHTLVRKHNLHH